MIEGSDPMFQPTTGIGYAGVPVVTLAGREFFLPKLVMTQNRKVIPIMMRIAPAFSELQSSVSEGEDAGLAFAGLLTEDLMNDLCDMVFTALTRAYPNLTEAAFLDLEISPEELITAANVVMQQTGLFKKPSDKDASPGEGQGEI